MAAYGSSKDPRQAIRYEVVSLAERPELSARHNALGSAAWPEFMLHDPVPNQHWDRLMTLFGAQQLTLLSGDEILAVINTVPLRIDSGLKRLPDRGVDWGIEKSVKDHKAGTSPNCLMGIQVVVNQVYRGRGLSDVAVDEMLSLTTHLGLGRLILPLRPNDKPRFPLIPMVDYIAWTSDEGLPYDRWLRVHVRRGGEIAGVCSKSMIIPGTVAEWSSWTQSEYPGSGRYLVSGALSPVAIDVGRDLGVYREANVWIVHTIQEAVRHW
jgi:hypothetical protein